MLFCHTVPALADHGAHRVSASLRALSFIVLLEPPQPRLKKVGHLSEKETKDQRGQVGSKATQSVSSRWASLFGAGILCPFPAAYDATARPVSVYFSGRFPQSGGSEECT